MVADETDANGGGASSANEKQWEELAATATWNLQHTHRTANPATAAHRLQPRKCAEKGGRTLHTGGQNTRQATSRRTYIQGCRGRVTPGMLYRPLRF